jgi:hypothetical protein
MLKLYKHLDLPSSMTYYVPALFQWDENDRGAWKKLLLSKANTPNFPAAGAGRRGCAK